MRWQSAVAIYVLFWTLAAFVVMPFSVRGQQRADAARIPGEDAGAPVRMRPRFILGWTTVVATLGWAVFMLNYSYGWLDLSMLDVFTPAQFRRAE